MEHRPCRDPDRVDRLGNRDSQRWLGHEIVHAANIQDRGGGAMLLATLFGLYPFLLKLYADDGYQGSEFRKALAAIFAQIDVELV